MSTTRWIIERPCPDCEDQGHLTCNAIRIVVDPDNLPPEAIQRAALAMANWDATHTTSTYPEQAEAAVRAFLSDPEPGDQT